MTYSKKLHEFEAAILTKLNPVIKKLDISLAPVVKIATYLTAFYSVYMAIFLLGHYIFKWNVLWMIRFPGSLYVIMSLLAISFAMLIISGGFIEAWKILVCVMDLASGFIDRGSESTLGIIFELIVLFASMLFAVLIAICVPIIPILIHKFRNFEEKKAQEAERQRKEGRNVVKEIY